MLDATGFKRKRYSDLVDDMTLKAKELFGEDTNLSEKSFLGILIRLFAWFLAIIWEVAEKVYNSGFVSKAEGGQLDRLGAYIGISRLQATNETWKIQITGQPGYMIQDGTQFETSKGIIFELIDVVTLDDDGIGFGEVVCTQEGAIGNVNVGDICIFTNPDENLYSVTNTELLVQGRDRETDEEFRQRYFQSTSKTGASTIESIQATVLEVPGVKSVSITENSSSTEENGIPPHSFSVFVYGGSDQDVARAIFQTKPSGIQAFGKTVVPVQDSQGITHYIGFTRPSITNVFVRLTIQRGTNYPANGDDLVRTEVLTYFEQLMIGDDVIVSQLIRAVGNIDGVVDVSVELSTDGTTYVTSNLAIPSDSVAATTSDKVVIQ